jgi:alkaline phosphatase D
MAHNSLSRRRFIAGLPALGLGAAAASRAEEVVLQDIVFGSCLDTHDHPMLDRALTLPRDLFIFMGDNIYADKGGIPMMREKYVLLKQSRFYQGLRNKPILATWDDHDFGQNDGGAEYPNKKEAQEEFWNWLDEPAGSPRRRQEGVYHSQIFGPTGRRVQVILLDTRYFRGALKKVPKEQAMLGGAYVPTDDPAITLLGQTQWEWLERKLREPAELRLIVSSIQFAPEAHGGECWANLTRERQRMLDLIANTKASGVIFLSGDRHWCEFSKVDGRAGYPLYDYTSSSMTQKHSRGTPTPNANRLLPTTWHTPNVGHLHIEWNKSEARITTRIVDVEGAMRLEHQTMLGELKAR